MSSREFHLRLKSTYDGSDNAIRDMQVQVLSDREWVDLDLNTKTAGFLIFVYSIFTCQHLYLRSNAKERNLVMRSAKGAIHVGAANDWKIQELRINFDVDLATGKPAQSDIEYVIDRMKHCPASINLADVPQFDIAVNFNQ